MEKIAVGPEARGVIDLRDSPTDNLSRIAAAKGTRVRDLTVVVLDRPRHEDLVAEIRDAGARLKLIIDGDVAGALMSAMTGTGIDALMGIGGSPEAVIAACALKCVGGDMQGRLWARNDEERAARQATIRSTSIASGASTTSSRARKRSSRQPASPMANCSTACTTAHSGRHHAFAGDARTLRHRPLHHDHPPPRQAGVARHDSLGLTGATAMSRAAEHVSALFAFVCWGLSFRAELCHFGFAGNLSANVRRFLDCRAWSGMTAVTPVFALRTNGELLVPETSIIPHTCTHRLRHVEFRAHEDLSARCPLRRQAPPPCTRCVAGLNRLNQTASVQWIAGRGEVDVNAPLEAQWTLARTCGPPRSHACDKASPPGRWSTGTTRSGTACAHCLQGRCEQHGSHAASPLRFAHAKGAEPLSSRLRVADDFAVVCRDLEGRLRRDHRRTARPARRRHRPASAGSRFPGIPGAAGCRRPSLAG